MRSGSALQLVPSAETQMYNWQPQPSSAAAVVRVGLAMAAYLHRMQCQCQAVHLLFEMSNGFILLDYRRVDELDCVKSRFPVGPGNVSARNKKGPQREA